MRPVLKIAVVRPLVTAKKGGAERYAMELVKGLASRGHEIQVFANQWDEPGEGGVVYHRISMPRKPAWLRVLVFHWNLRRQLSRRDYDVVLGMTPFWPQTVCWLGDGLYYVWTRVAWPMAIVRWFMCMKRTVMTVNLWLERRMLGPRTDFILANSRLVKRQAMRYYGVPEGRIRVVYPGVDSIRFSPAVRPRWRHAMRQELGIKDPEVVLMFASNNFKRKGLDLVIRALGNIAQNGSPLKLLVVGAGRIGSFQRLANRCRVSARTLFVGATDAIEKYYAAADVFVLPTRYDPCAVVCLEAMACGLPVITSQMNGAAELIHAGENGFVVDSNRAQQDLQRCLGKLKSVGYCGQMGRDAERIAVNFSMSDHLEQMASRLEEMALSRRVRPVLEVMQLTPEVASNKSFSPLLQAHKLTSYTALTDNSTRTGMTYNRGKQIHMFSLSHDKVPRTFYLKQHRSHSSWLRAHLRGFGIGAITEGMREWRNILEFHRLGLPAVTPVAAGERLLPDGTAESFVITLALDGHTPLDDYLTTHFANPLNDAQRRKKRLLVEALARLTRAMHWNGVNHRDYYLCHVFVRDTVAEGVDLQIIDLQRAGYRRMLRRRWLVKDLAQLHFSSLHTPISNWDRLRFFATYSPPGNGRRQRRQVLRRVLRKSRSIAKHDAKINSRHNDVGLSEHRRWVHVLKSASKHDGELL